MKRTKYFMCLSSLLLIALPLVSCSENIEGSSSEGTISSVSSQDSIGESSQVATYSVVFKNGETILQSDTVEAGSYATYRGETPTKDPTVDKVYAFSGWDKDPSSTLIVEDTIFTAQFTDSVRTYKATFVNGEETLYETNVEYQSCAEYQGATPTKQDDDNYRYIFTGWEPSLSTPMVKDTTFAAQFKQASLKEVVYDFEDMEVGDSFGDWTVAEENGNKYITASGSTWTEGAVTDYLYNNELKTVATNWEMSAKVYLVGNIPGNIDFLSDSIYEHAEDTTNKFLYWHTDENNGFVMSYSDSTNWVDGNVKLDCGWLTMHEVGTDANIGEVVHNAWVDIKMVNLGGQVSIYFNEHLMGRAILPVQPIEDIKFSIFMSTPEAQVKFDDFKLKAVDAYTVTFKNGDDVLQTYKVQAGEVPVYTGTTPTKDASGATAYVFAGWNPDVTQGVTEDTVYQAQFNEEDRKVKATFKNGETVLLEQDVVYGNTPNYTGTTPTKEGSDGVNYKFIGWEPALGNITEDTVYVAKFKEYGDNVWGYDFEDMQVGEAFGGFAVNGDDTNKWIESSGSGWVSPKIAPLYNGELTALDQNWEMSADIFVPNYAGNINFISDSIYDCNEGTFNKFIYLHSNPGNAFMMSYTNSTNDVDGTQITDFGWLTMHGVSDDEHIGDVLHNNWLNIKYVKIGNTMSLYVNNNLMGTFTHETNKLLDLSFAICMSDPAATVQLDNFQIKTLETVKATFKNGETTIYEQTLVKGTTPTFGGTTPTRENDGSDYEFVGWDKELAPITQDTTYAATFKKSTTYSQNFDSLVIGEAFGDWVVAGDDTNKYISGSGSGWVSPIQTAKLYDNNLTMDDNWEISVDLYLLGNIAGNMSFVSDSLIDTTTSFSKFVFWHTDENNGYVQGYTNSSNEAEGTLLYDFGWITQHGVATDENVGTVVHNNWVNLRFVYENGTLSIYMNNYLYGTATLTLNTLEDVSFRIAMSAPEAIVSLDNFSVKSYSYVN